MNIELPTSGSDVTKHKSLQVRCGVVCVVGRHLNNENWRMEFFVRVVQRKQTGSRNWQARFMIPTDVFADRLKERGFNVVRHNSNRLIGERITLPNGVAGLCLRLEAAFPPDQQDELWTDSTPERWGEFTIPETKSIKRFWIGEA